MTAISALRLLFWLILAAMLAAIGRASALCPLFEIPREVLRHPWFVTTLIDAYLAFFVVYLWVAWKERSTAARVLWFFVLMLWGNVGIAVYVLRELYRLDRYGQPLRLVSEARPGHVLLPAVLTALAVLVYLWGARGHFA
jgi:hypothetical protein